MTFDRGLACFAASEFREAGLRVFALHQIKNGKCTCGNPECPAESAGKHPVASNWQHTPEWSDDQWQAICDYQIKTGYGILCRNLLVVDVDNRNGGNASLEKLIAAVPGISGAGLIVNTGSGDGSRHYYFSVPSDAALLYHHPDYPGIEFKSSGYVVGPGSLHRSGNTYSTTVGAPLDIDDAPEALMTLLRRPEKHRTNFNGNQVDVSHKDIAEILSFIEPDSDYEVWYRCGMAVHDATGGTGFDVWDEWSRKGDKYKPDEMGSKWHSFGRSLNPVRIGTLIFYAEEAGYIVPVTFAPQLQFEAKKDSDLPFDISGVDLKCPPGFVGDVAAWIEDQSRRPRENLAVAAALTAIGNIAGLRYTDDRDGVTTNMFAFCIAGSRTGKEAIQQAVTLIHRVAGISGATHGAIKSEQEIVRNLTRHQSAYYIIDEIGIFLQKIKNAQQKGGASYLDGVIGMLMAAYSKADGFMLLTGDVKEELRQALIKELAQIHRKIEENEASKGEERRVDKIESTLSNLDKGLERPFLSMIGFTTPVMFEDLVDFNSATNGFVGRALLFNERETVPLSKRRFKRRRMSTAMEHTIAQIFTSGEYDMMGSTRVEYYGERKEIPTSRAAHDMLDSALEWFETQAVKAKGSTGLEALMLGAYELVSKVALVLAIPEGLRNEEHVRWAFALIRRDILEKTRLVISNDREKDSPKMALYARLENLIAGDGETLGVILNRTRKIRREDVKTALNDLVISGIAEKTEKKGRNNKATAFYCLLDA